MASNKLFRYTKNIFLNKKLVTFLVCVIISTFLWLINALNRNYTKNISIPLKYINLPQNKLLSIELPTSIESEIKTSGAKMFFIEYSNSQRPLIVDVSKAQVKKPKQYVISVSSILSNTNISNLFKTEVEIVDFKPDSLYFNFGKTFSKVVPVKPKLQIQLDPFYNYKNNTTVQPSTVTIYGDSSFVSRIDSICTEKIILNDFNSNIQQNAKLFIPEEYENRIGLSSSEVKISVNIDKYTESSIEIPLESVNVPNGFVMKTFPNKVKITFQVPMNEFEKVNSSELNATVSYSEARKNKLKIEVSSKNPNIKITKISPEKVEYILRKE